MDNNNKDIYELLNDTEFDITEENELPLNDIQKQRIKKHVKKNIGKKGFGRKKIVVAAIALFIVTAIILPTGQNVIAAIKDKLFFNPGLGLVNTDEQVYILNEPINVTSNHGKILVKSVISKRDFVEVGIWIEDKSKGNWTKEDFLNEQDVVRESIYIKTLTGEVLSIENYNIAGGGENKFMQVSFGTQDILKNFTLVVNNDEIKIDLINAEEKYSYDEVGGNSTDKDLLVGGNMYTFQDDIYIAFWTNEEVKKNGAYYIGYNTDDIKVSDKQGNSYELTHSQYDGLGKEFLVGRNISAPLDVAISKIELEYSLQNPMKMKLDIPKKGETAEVNKEIYIEELEEKILVKSITNTDEGIEICFDTEKFEKEDSNVIMVNTFGRGWELEQAQGIKK